MLVSRILPTFILAVATLLSPALALSQNLSTDDAHRFSLRSLSTDLDIGLGISLPDICVSTRVAIADELLGVLNVATSLLTNLLDILLGIKLDLGLGIKVDLCLCVSGIDLFFQTGLKADLKAKLKSLGKTDDEIKAALRLWIAAQVQLPTPPVCLGSAGVLGRPVALGVSSTCALKGCDTKCLAGFEPDSKGGCKLMPPPVACVSPQISINNVCVCPAANTCSNGSCATLCPSSGASTKTTRRKRALVKGRSHCTRKGWQFCPISAKGSAGWECVDTSADLESCGGCPSTPAPSDLAFARDQQFSLRLGQDCSAIPNVNSVSCRAGSCEVLSCLRGWVVSSARDSCVLSSI